jgi:hypothetical protein
MCRAIQNAVVHGGGVRVQLPCEFGPGAGHLLARSVASFIGVSRSLGPWIASLLSTFYLYVWPASGLQPPLYAPKQQRAAARTSEQHAGATLDGVQCLLMISMGVSQHVPPGAGNEEAHGEADLARRGRIRRSLQITSHNSTVQYSTVIVGGDPKPQH